MERSQNPLHIPNWSGDSFSGLQLTSFLRTFGIHEDTILVAGWYAGYDYVLLQSDVLGSEPVGRLSLVEGTDRDWMVWEAPARLVVATVLVHRNGPGLLMPSRRALWILESPLASPTTRLYPAAG